MTKVVFAISFLISAFTLAAKPMDLPACQAIAKQCAAAGFEPGDHKKNGKGLWVDCVGAIAHGKTVTGVTATQAEAKTCADASKAARAAKHK